MSWGGAPRLFVFAVGERSRGVPGVWGGRFPKAEIVGDVLPLERHPVLSLWAFYIGATTTTATLRGQDLYFRGPSTP